VAAQQALDAGADVEGALQFQLGIAELRVEPLGLGRLVK